MTTIIESIITCPECNSSEKETVKLDSHFAEEFTPNIVKLTHSLV